MANLGVMLTQANCNGCCKGMRFEVLPHPPYSPDPFIKTETTGQATVMITNLWMPFRLGERLPVLHHSADYIIPLGITEPYLKVDARGLYMVANEET